jgi:hypothetical protein
MGANTIWKKVQKREIQKEKYTQSRRKIVSREEERTGEVARGGTSSSKCKRCE